MTPVARWCHDHRWFVAGAWLVVLLAATPFALSTGARTSSQAGAPGSESQRAMDLLPVIVPGGKVPDTETVVVHAPGGDLRRADQRARVDQLVTGLGRLPGVAAALSPYDAGGRAALGVDPVSADGDTVLVAVLMKGSALAPDLAAVHGLEVEARATSTDGLRVELLGPGITTAVQGTISTGPFVVGGLAALLVLCVALRTTAAVVAAALPGVATTAGGQVLVALVSRTTPISPLAPLLAALLGLAVSLGAGIVIVHRCQLGLRAGLAPRAATVAAMVGPGQAALLGAGSLTAVALGAWILGLGGFVEFAPAVAPVAAFAALAIATLPPAVLGLGCRWLPPRSELGQVRPAGTGPPRRAGLRTWWAGQVGQRPWSAVVAAAGVLVLLGVPSIGLRLGASDPGVDPASTTTRRAYDLMGQDFGPGLSGPFILVARDTPAGGPDAVARLVKAVAATPGVSSAAVALDRPDLGLAMLRAFPAGEPRAADTTALLHRLRARTVPSVVAGTGMSVEIGGQTALFADTADQLTDALPLFFGLVISAVSFAALVLTRRALVAAAVGVADLVVIGSTLGVLGLFAGSTPLAGLLGARTGPIEPFVVVFVLFGAVGLAVGMQLGLLSRLADNRRTAPRAGGSGVAAPRRRAAVRHRELVCAAHADAASITLTISLIMAALFLGFAAQQPRLLAVMGAALAAAIGVDALVLRGTLLPGILHVLPATPPATSRPTSDTARARDLHRSGPGTRTAAGPAQDTSPLAAGGRQRGAAAAPGGRPARQPTPYPAHPHAHHRVVRHQAQPAGSPAPGPAPGYPPRTIAGTGQERTTLPLRRLEPTPASRRGAGPSLPPQRVFAAPADPPDDHGRRSGR